MEGNKRKLFDTQKSTQFKHKGPNKKMKWTNSSGQSPLSSLPSDTTMYRILCPSKKIGSVIGKGGRIIKALREETHSKINVDGSVPNSYERVINIYSSPAKVSTADTNNEKSSAENELRVMEFHCATQDALLKVHKRIVEDDRSSGMPSDEENESGVITVGLLVPNNMVGCILGKGGDVIKRLRSETDAKIRIFPPEQLPACALSTDELVQGAITTRLPVPSNKVGCILGQGGQVINEMRKRTLADIRIFSKDDKPKCASDDEELIQISGNASVSKDALAEIASRLTVRTLRDKNAGAEPRPIGPSLGYDPGRNLPGGRTYSSAPTRATSSSGYEPVFRGGPRDYEPQSYQIPPRYQHANNGFEHSASSNGANSDVFARVSLRSDVHQGPGQRTRLQDPQFDGSRTFMERPASAEHFSETGQSYMTRDINGTHRGQHQNSFQQSSYPASNSEQQQYIEMNAHSTYRNNNNIQPSGFKNYSNYATPYGAAYSSQQGGYWKY